MEKKRKIEDAALGEKVLYLVAAALAPCAPLFFLYNQNVSEGLKFTHCLVLGAILMVFSIMMQTVLSFVMRKRGTPLVIVMLFWAAFWYFESFHKLALRATTKIFRKMYPSGLEYRFLTAIIIFIIISSIAIFLNRVKLNKLVSNTVALMLCMLFAFNFIPAVSVATQGQMAKGDENPYELKSEFNVNDELPRPNIYWLHMDGMVGFSAFEQYFGDPQTDLKNTLREQGFVINETAEMGGGKTVVSLPGQFSPDFFDSWLAIEYEKNANLTRMERVEAVLSKARETGFNLYDDIYRDAELLKVLSDVGYTITGNREVIEYSAVSDIINDGITITSISEEWRNIENSFATILEFKDLMVDASALKLLKKNIDFRFEEMRPVRPESATEIIPQYPEDVEKYLDKYSARDSSSTNRMKRQVRAAKYAAEMEDPHFFYFNDTILHCKQYRDTIGRVFELDENGNKIDLESIGDNSIYDLKKYFPPQYRYAVKQMMAKVDVIIENDPDAVIVIQADHGIHGLGPAGTQYYDNATFLKQGYSIDDMQNLNKSVISAVRIPEKYGKLSEPLNPLDISRYLVNNFVGEDNYDYLYYKE
jgi:hypothetical protein